ncbi:hypothetical protein BLNAU_12761 [Blattamonas nauphoetae]|uniref:Uncharacterized protein n=1 Tax=Blattamonas nauphoetae TaxID=2049346 RepID=A0ABQ9XK26_9EUKA|nr:hypothetical protein BLNAU_12761 [Blattamonas nauphoetae]
MFLLLLKLMNSSLRAEYTLDTTFNICQRVPGVEFGCIDTVLFDAVIPASDTRPGAKEFVFHAGNFTDRFNTSCRVENDFTLKIEPIGSYFTLGITTKEPTVHTSGEYGYYPITPGSLYLHYNLTTTLNNRERLYAVSTETAMDEFSLMVPSMKHSNSLRSLKNVSVLTETPHYVKLNVTERTKLKPLLDAAILTQDDYCCSNDPTNAETFESFLNSRVPGWLINESIYSPKHFSVQVNSFPETHIQFLQPLTKVGFTPLIPSLTLDAATSVLVDAAAMMVHVTISNANETGDIWIKMSAHTSDGVQLRAGSEQFVSIIKNTKKIVYFRVSHPNPPDNTDWMQQVNCTVLAGAGLNIVLSSNFITSVPVYTSDSNTVSRHTNDDDQVDIQVKENCEGQAYHWVYRKTDGYCAKCREHETYSNGVCSPGNCTALMGATYYVFMVTSGHCEEKTICSSEEEYDPETNTCVEPSNKTTLIEPDCSNHGTLVEGTCECEEGWITTPEKLAEFIMCSEKAVPPDTSGMNAFTPQSVNWFMVWIIILAALLAIVVTIMVWCCCSKKGLCCCPKGSLCCCSGSSDDEIIALKNQLRFNGSPNPNLQPWQNNYNPQYQPQWGPYANYPGPEFEYPPEPDLWNGKLPLSYPTPRQPPQYLSTPITERTEPYSSQHMPSPLTRPPRQPNMAMVSSNSRQKKRSPPKLNQMEEEVSSKPYSPSKTSPIPSNRSMNPEHTHSAIIPNQISRRRDQNTGEIQRSGQLRTSGHVPPSSHRAQNTRPSQVSRTSSHVPLVKRRQDDFFE